MRDSPAKNKTACFKPNNLVNLLPSIGMQQLVDAHPKAPRVGEKCRDIAEHDTFVRKVNDSADVVFDRFALVWHLCGLPSERVRGRIGMKNREVTLTRSQVIGGLIAMLAAAGMGVFAARRLRPEPEFEPFPGVPGFRRTEGGAVSSVRDVFAGLDGSGGLALPPPPSGTALCKALFDGGPVGRVAVASFSDYFCPYCRILTEKLVAMESEGLVHVTWHELPLLGEGSRIAARAAIAADMQGRYADFHRRLMRAQFQPTEAYIRDLAQSAGLDLDRFSADLASDNIDARLQRSRDAARAFGLFGTPALVVGRTVVVGAISEPDLRAVIAVEAADPGSVC